jgi:hypothetical protein
LCKDAYKIASQFFRSGFYGLISPWAAPGIGVEMPKALERAGHNFALAKLLLAHATWIARFFAALRGKKGAQILAVILRR